MSWPNLVACLICIPLHYVTYIRSSSVKCKHTLYSSAESVWNLMSFFPSIYLSLSLFARSAFLSGASIKATTLYTIYHSQHGNNELCAICLCRSPSAFHSLVVVQFKYCFFCCNLAHSYELCENASKLTFNLFRCSLLYVHTGKKPTHWILSLYCL